MNGNNALFDSNIIIYLSKKSLKLDNYITRYDNFNISLISYIETLGYNFKDKSEEDLIASFLKTFKVLPINIEIADLVIKYRKTSKIKIPDAIILATAAISESILITNNLSDFQDIDSSVQIEEVNPEKDQHD